MNIKDKKIVFCIPGSHVSMQFMLQLFDLLGYCREQGAEVEISPGYSSMVSFARIHCLNADGRPGKRQRPFCNKKYDYIMWIDSDIQFSRDSFIKLVEHDRDIVSGWYMVPEDHMSRNFTSSVLEPYYLGDGGMQLGIRMIGVEDIQSRTELFKPSAAGMGWMLVKHGVFEQLEFPWFVPKKIEQNGSYRLTGEDVAFCMDAEAAGFDIWVDPSIKVNHEKTVVV